MDDFSAILTSSHPQLKEVDCLPVSDTGHRIIYGRDDGAPFQLDVSFGLNRMIIRQLSVRSDLQRQGLGTTITAYLKRESGRLAIPEVWLYAVVQGSTTFWEKVGFSLLNTHEECGGFWRNST